MAYPSVTFTFTNGTTASASQMNQNLTDLINAMSDSTKDFSISALTTAGTVTFNGNVNLGNASSDDLSITASLATSLAIKTNNTYDIGGAGLGLAGLYLGAPSSRSTRITAHQSLSGSNTLVLPNGNGNLYEYLQTDGSGNLSWVAPRLEPSTALNYSLSCSVGSNALTITLKGADGNSLSSTNVAWFNFRNATIATGTPALVKSTSDLSLTISSGSTLGHGSNREQYIYVYAINNSGTVELATCTVYNQQDGIISTTAEGGAGAADSNRLFYSTTARSNVAYLLLGRLDSTQTTAGTWAAVPTRITLGQKVEKKVTLRYTSNSGQTADSAIEFEDLDFDVANAYNTSNGTFTSPKAMKARVYFKVRPTSNIDVELYISKNGGATIYNKTIGAAGVPGCICMDELDLAAGDTIVASSATSFSLSTNAGENVLTISEI